MELSPQQDGAIATFREWWKNRSPDDLVFHLHGYAGTGKTTLARMLAEEIKGRVFYAAYTGKAASVMRRKGCAGARTLHSLLYNVKQGSKKYLIDLELEMSRTEDATKLAELAALRDQARKALARPSWELNPFSDLRDAALIVIDEVSMVDERIAKDILYFKKPVLALGDPAQLPPVMGAGYFNIERPEVMLTEVHRVALDNPVLHLATRVRNGEKLNLGDYGDSRVVRRAELQGGETLEYDQILVGRNATRQFANRTMRSRLGYDGTWPVKGEKLVCLRNDHEAGFLNGTIWTVESAEYDNAGVELLVRPEDDPEAPAVEAYAHAEPFLYQDAPRWGGNRLHEFTYGYALTTHKAQGSEWPKVYIVDESAAFRQDAPRWLYTAITRASESVLLIR